MPSSMADMLNTLINFKQVQNQTQKIAQAGATQAVQGVSTFMDLARHTADPTQLTALVDRFAQLGVGTSEQLTNILQHVTPTADATRDYMAKLGVDINAGKRPAGTTDATAAQAGEAANVATTGMNAGQLGASGFLSSVFQHTNPADPQLAAGLASRTAAGMTPGEMAIDAATAALPPNEQTQAAGVKAGTRMSAPQDAANQLGWGQLREEARYHENANALGIAAQEVELAKSKAAARGVDPQVITNLIDAKQKLLATLQAKKDQNPSKQELLSFIGGFNAINAAMSAYGLPNEGQLDYNPDILLQPGFFDKKFKTPITSSPTNVAPPGTGRR